MNESDWEDAIPFSYANSETKIGRVYLGIFDGPPLKIRKWKVGDDVEKRCIVVEMENVIETVENKKPTITRICIHLSDSRKLCCHLIHALSHSGDAIGKMLVDTMNKEFSNLISQGS
jgi:hypothetical protein